jgi:acyl-CoA thioesterase-2
MCLHFLHYRIERICFAVRVSIFVFLCRYGGQILGQALAAAIKTVKGSKEIHSMHAYFLRKGNEDENLIYTVQNLRDGKSFSTRLVRAQQDGEDSFIMICSFQVPDPERTISHQHAMPKVAPPSDLPNEHQYYRNLAQDFRCPPKWKPGLLARASRDSPLDWRIAVVNDFFADLGQPASDRPKYPEFTHEPRQIMWMRSKTRLSDDKNEHVAVLAYASDMGLIYSFI